MIENSVEEAIEIEQDIMSGVDAERCEPIKPDTLAKSVMQFADSQKERPHLQFRVFALFLIYYDVPEKTWQEMLKRLRGADD